MVRAVIIEDEAHLRELLRIIIKEVDDEIEIIAECDNIKDAEEVIHHLQPALIFLDVIMPGGTGFDLLEKIPPNTCEIIFITAHDSHTLEAFRHAAIGYLLKPVDKDDLRIAITNAKRRIQSNYKQQDFIKFLDDLKGNRTSNEKIAIPTQDGFLFVTANEIVRCESDKVYTWIHLASGRSVLCSYNLGEFRKILPERSFFQVHKSHIVSFTYVKMYHAKDNTVELTDGSIVPVSRRNKFSFLNNFRQVSRGME
jgi:two-component system LytT family response regulator